MLEMVGTLENTFTAPTGVNKKTGEEYGGQHRIQLMAETIMQNGEKRLEMVTLTVENLQPYRDYLKQSIRLPVGCFARNNGISFYVPKGSIPEPATSNPHGV